jgi:hypothetical protein
MAKAGAVVKAEPKKNLPVSFQAEIQREIEENANRVSASTSKAIGIMQKKMFKMPDGTEHPGPLEVVVLDFAYGNNFYKKPYKDGQKEVTPPDCFARGRSLKGLVPSASVKVKEAAACDTCPNNQFGSKGDGKACSNNGYLAVMTPDAAADDPIYTIKISPTAIKAWDAYVNTLRNKFNKVPLQFITKVSFDPASAYPSLRFGDPQPNPRVEEVFFARRAEAREILAVEPDVSKLEAPKKGKK